MDFFLMSFDLICIGNIQKIYSKENNLKLGLIERNEISSQIVWRKEKSDFG